MLPAYLTFVVKKSPHLETNIYKYLADISKYELSKSLSLPAHFNLNESSELEKIIQSFISLNTKDLPSKQIAKSRIKQVKSKTAAINQIFTLDYEFPSEMEDDGIINFSLKDKIYKDKLLSIFTTLGTKDLIYMNVSLDKVIFMRLFINSNDNKLIFHKTEIDLKPYFEIENLTTSFLNILNEDKLLDRAFESFLNGLNFASKSEDSSYFFFKLLQKAFEKIIEDPKFLIGSFAKHPTLRPTLIIGGSMEALIGASNSVVMSADLLKAEGFFSAYFDKDNIFFPSLTSIEKTGNTNPVLETFISSFMQDCYWGTFLSVSDKAKKREYNELLADINIKDGYSNKSVFGSSGNLLRFNFIESGSLDVKFKKGAGVKIFDNRNFELENLRKNVIFDFRNFDPASKLSDISLFHNFINWNKSLNA